ncbi:hypothetical protein MNEG_12709 [Monoraphidium neglectum]|uniref:Uncharacterized protein n=1 Tax=Monoraphidium neglectum TaxID=145388 RepID=A0A0D2J5U6_9CHLO|nr:hypothetical protein MNEG_12709 [Monoraphidium neglectum]KIY95252.1 hypothetical protein MNEG_12709 [Monoraphidium neglectum]|eukprot:XP_013894272.1 hypothetical protein MNEG_12709 [Monoraphidium neglectum]
MSEDNEKPWTRRLRQLREQRDQAEAAAAAAAADPSRSGQHHNHPQQPEVILDGEPTELQKQLVECYRKTFLVTGAALIGSVFHWNYVGKLKVEQVFVPPRAQSLPAEVVEGWTRSMRFKEGVRAVGRQTVFATGVAALYFGAELASQRLRGVKDWANTAVAGAVAGGCLGSRLPGPSRARGAALGAALGSALGAASGLALQQAEAMLPDAQQAAQERERAAADAQRRLWEGEGGAQGG